MDPRGERPVYSCLVYSEVGEEILGLRYHATDVSENGNGNRLVVPPVLIIRYMHTRGEPGFRKTKTHAFSTNAQSRFVSVVPGHTTN